MLCQVDVQASSLNQSYLLVKTAGLNIDLAKHLVLGCSCHIRNMWPPWPNGQGVGLLIRRLWVRVPQGVFVYVYVTQRMFFSVGRWFSV
jgi:hypothetical protein